MTFRLQTNDRNMRVAANVAFTVILINVQRRAFQVLSDTVEVPWVQKDILPVDAAFAAGSTVKFEGIVKANGTSLKIFCDIFHTHYIYSYALGVPRNVDTPDFL